MSLTKILDVRLMFRIMRKRRNIDRAVAVARGRYAAAKHFHPDGDHTHIKRELVEANIAAYVKKALATTPLSDEQRARLTELLKPGM